MAPASPARLAGWASFFRALCSPRAWLLPAGRLLLDVLALPGRAKAPRGTAGPPTSVARKGVGAVFLGDALSVRRVSNRDIETRFRVDAIWEGEGQKRNYITVRTIEDSAMCGRRLSAEPFLSHLRTAQRTRKPFRPRRQSRIGHSPEHRQRTQSPGAPAMDANIPTTGSRDTASTAASATVQSEHAPFFATRPTLLSIVTTLLNRRRKPSQCR